MDRYFTRETLIKINQWLIGLQQHRIPQLFVALSGAVGIMCGILFLAVPTRFDTSPQLEYLTNAIPTQAWVVIFFGFGFSLLTCAVVRYSAAVLPCMLFAVAMFVFMIMTAVDVVEGPATGITTVLAFAFGSLNALTSIMAVAPISDRILHSVDHKRGAA